MKSRYWMTGVSSFVGAALAQSWARKGHDVIGVHSQPIESYEKVRRKRLDALTAVGVKLEVVNLLDATSLKSSIESAHPTVAVHHAGWVDGYAGWDYDFNRGYAINVAPLSVLCETLSRIGTKGLIVTGSSAEYGDATGPHHESEKEMPTLPYGLSKLMETRRVEQLSLHHEVRVRVGRLFIPFGPGDTPAKVMPSVVEALCQGKPIELSPCEQRRDFVHIDDIIEGYNRLVLDLDRPALFDVYNLSGGHSVRLRDVLETLAGDLGAEQKLLCFGARPLRQGEVPTCYGSNQKIYRATGWRPLSWKEGVRHYATAVRGLCNP